MKPFLIRLLSALFLACAVESVCAQQAQPVRVLLQLDRDRMDVMLMGREGGNLLFRRHDAPEGVGASMPVSAIRAGEFDVEIDESLSLAAAREMKWEQAAQLLLARIGPALPFLDIPENNVILPALQSGGYLMIAARAAALKPGENNRETANRLYRAAYGILRAAGRAENWHPQGKPARLRAVMCLVEMGRLDDAEREFKAVEEPARGDGAFGVYALARARLTYARGDSRAALDLLIPSILYENKDVDVFPESLMLSAECYEDILEIHRTRDVYYEIARLFPGTEWAVEARQRLWTIHRNQMTKETEDVDVVAVFFAGKEDMDEVVAEYLDKTEPKVEKK